jgi:hypothetical protein
MGENRPVVDKRVELAALATGVDCGRELVQQRLVERSSHEAATELVTVDGDERRAKTVRYKRARERPCVPVPQGE